MKEQTGVGSLTDPHPSSHSASFRDAPCLVSGRRPGHWGVVDTCVVCELTPDGSSSHEVRPLHRLLQGEQRISCFTFPAPWGADKAPPVSAPQACSCKGPSPCRWHRASSPPPQAGRGLKAGNKARSMEPGLYLENKTGKDDAPDG